MVVENPTGGGQDLVVVDVVDNVRILSMVVDHFVMNCLISEWLIHGGSSILVNSMVVDNIG